MSPRPWARLLLLPLVACGAEREDLGTAAEPVAVCAQASTLEGVDVSHYNGDIDWAKVGASGKAFAFVKATEGLTYVDPLFALNWAAMKDSGIVRGAYHFFHADADPVMEADHFLETMGPLEPGDLPPTLDLEVTDGVDGATITKNAGLWLDRVAGATGLKPIVYTSPSFVTGILGSPPELGAGALLWVAHWGVACPSVPGPYSSWAFWQESNAAAVPGVDAGAVDLDIFNGTTDDLEALTAGVTPPNASSSASSEMSSSSTAAAGGAMGDSSVTSSEAAAAGDAAGAGGAAGTTFESGGGATSLGTGGGVEAISASPSATRSFRLHAGCALMPARSDLRFGAWLLAILLATRRRRARRPSLLEATTPASRRSP